MMLRFTKMQGAGNDFVMIDGIRQSFEPDPKNLRQLADRHFGVGCDQILLVEKAERADADVRYRIFNADGSEVEHCGNGARCFVRFVRQQGLCDSNPVRAEISTGVLDLFEHPDGEVSVAMGQTRFDPEDLQFDPQGLTPVFLEQAGFWPLEGIDDSVSPQPGVWSPETSVTAFVIEATTIHSRERTQLPDQAPVWVSLVAISNPHAVLRVDDVDTAPVGLWGPRIESHWRFARRVNAGFMQVIHPQHIRLRVFERGVGETLACGTGACAAVAAGIRAGWLQSPVQVDARGGTLTVSWDGENLILKGPAVRVFDGVIELPT